jgi:regulator of nonsense transcripts 2
MRGRACGRAVIAAGELFVAAPFAEVGTKNLVSFVEFVGFRRVDMADSSGDVSASQAAAEPTNAAEHSAAHTAFDPDEPKKIELRDQNAHLSANRPKDDELKKRDSTVKKCTSMTGRLKHVKEDWLDGRFLQELERVNLSKCDCCASFTMRVWMIVTRGCRRYISEMATAIGELKLKAAEVWATVQIVSRLHCTYADFAPALVVQLKKVFEPAFSEAYPERRDRLSRRRSTLRLLYEA